MSGQQLFEYVGHTAIVYSVAAHSSGDIASGSEDGFAKIWRGIFIFIRYFVFNHVKKKLAKSKYEDFYNLFNIISVAQSV